jgi:hypothetical protein
MIHTHRNISSLTNVPHFLPCNFSSTGEKDGSPNRVDMQFSGLMAGSKLIVPVRFSMATNGNYLILFSAKRLSLFDIYVLCVLLPED